MQSAVPKGQGGTMGDIWEADDKVYYSEGGVVLKARVKRRLETGETDYLLQNQKNQGL